MKIDIIALMISSSFFYAFHNQAAYTGKPYKNIIQQIPGRVECELYDEGGEGVAYHDTDSINNGSGRLNPANGTFLNEFRMKEGVDISYTKTGDIDNNAYNKVPRDMGKLYVGWTVPGEWIKYSVNVQRTGKFHFDLMYTANGDGLIAIDIDGREIAGALKVSTTHDDRDTVKWRQWHHWNKAESLAKVELKKGVHVLTLHVVGNGNMNFDYLEFKED